MGALLSVGMGPVEIVADVLLAVYASERTRESRAAREAARQVAEKVLADLAAAGWQLTKDDG